MFKLPWTHKPRANRWEAKFSLGPWIDNRIKVYQHNIGFDNEPAVWWAEINGYLVRNPAMAEDPTSTYPDLHTSDFASADEAKLHAEKALRQAARALADSLRYR